jgi:hydrogenase-1 operon protein HyaF
MAMMNSIEHIPIQVIDGHQSQQVTANVMAILHEINNLLLELLEANKADSIDLRSLPLLPGEYEALKVVLGKGEVSVRLETLGLTDIYETRLAGVWWVIHDDENGERLAESIEVTRIPEIIKSDRLEIQFAGSALQQQLSEWADQEVVTNT